MTCFLGHRWTAWGPPQKATDAFGPITIQKKHCTGCQKVNVREVSAGVSMRDIGA